MACKNTQRWPTKFVADAYHYLIEEETDKKNYFLGYTTYDRVWVTYYDCYIIVHCVYHRTKTKVTFARKSGDNLVYVSCKTKSIGDNE
jgi:hypothetical protein